MTLRLCPCGRQIYANIGGLCHSCLADRRQRRADEPAKVLRLPSVDQDRKPAHLAWIRRQPCAVSGCDGKAQAAHVRMNTGGGMGLKPSDDWTIPLCMNHHTEQHRIGHDAFDRKYNLDSRALAESLALTSPFLGEHVDE